MVHEKLETRRILKRCLMLMNAIPMGSRDKDVMVIRTNVNRKYDKLTRELTVDINEKLGEDIT